ncbi:MAG TPA: glycosyltransferase family 4 protein [Verrucomicrobiae bacterium]|nr:glycosyltransferase family 4 protein [Verrucomicrobiae bacterium]
MNIGVLTHEPFYPPSGGGSSQAIYLIEEMVRRGHEVHLFAPQLENVAELETKFQIKIHPFTAWQMGRYTSLRSLKYLAYPIFLKRLVRKIARENKFDALLAQHAISCAAAGSLRRELNCAVAMNFLDYLTGYFDSWPKYLAPPPLVKRLKHFELSLPVKYRAEGIFTISDELADLFKQVGYPAEKILPIYYGYDGQLFQPTFQTSPTPLVVMHGSLDHHHINEFGARALIQIFRKRPETKFRFVGKKTDALRRTLEMLKNQIPDSAIECTDFVPYTEVAKKIHDATVGIVPYATSTGAQCTMVAKTVEYAAMGVPMVCTPLRGTMRYWQNNSIIRFSEMNPESFAEKVLSWFDESPENRHAWGRAASAKVSAELDWQPFSRRVVERLEEIHQQRNR